MQHFAMAVALSLAGFSTAAAAEQAPITGDRPFADKPFAAAEIVRLNEPWALAFLPDGRMLVTEKAGKLLLLSAKGGSKRVEVTGVPKVSSSGQGALGEVVLHPDFASNGMIYLSYSAPGSPNGIELMRAKLEAGAGQARLVEPAVLYRASPPKSGGHYAGRIAFHDGHLFLALGERQKFDPAQDKAGVLGKVLRLTMDGKPAPGNPLVDKGFDPAVWSFGHRNPLGLAFDGKGRLWDAEMGPKGGDEVNLVLPGRNYGWPLVSNGDHYDGRPIPDHPTRPDLEAPKVSWNPSISPSGMIVYDGALFPSWQGKGLVSALSGEMLLLIDLGTDSAREEARYSMGARIRAVRQGPDGAVYLLEDGKNARLLRLAPRD